jgi:hypothetical protein
MEGHHQRIAHGGLRLVISIGHEDAMMSPDEGLEKGIATLKEAVISKAGEMSGHKD